MHQSLDKDGTPIFILLLGSSHALHLTTLGNTKTVGFSYHRALSLPGTPGCPICLANKSSFTFPDVAQSWCLLQVLFSGSRDCPCCVPSLAAAPASLTPPVPPYLASMFPHLLPCRLLDYHPPWHRGGTLNLFIKWINTELPQFRQSQCYPLGSQSKPALVFLREAFQGLESHLIFTAGLE